MRHYACLLDACCVAAAESQVFGTAYTVRNGFAVLAPVRDPDKLNARGPAPDCHPAPASSWRLPRPALPCASQPVPPHADGHPLGLVLAC
ncbi:hypothetical protein RKE29_25205 [Streptomyces sp. B1866]|uniref:hypothetical protein n=1 Tax=Streptomyces sp. B1866 TaxID=3075431 RepID=UPI00288DA6C5|nr:hypothetical protein [Streptomyces sp. B1866]MDT3399891.1 hypothetical protein [Streptomyces sp. B1866]